jgi:pimeloyl-ACP methyl ester carboxylesterase
MMIVLATLAAAALAVGQAAASTPPTETQIAAPGPQGDLAGTMLEPTGRSPAPVVLMIPGSGPTDRDGNNPMGVKAASLKLLAEGLAAHGISSVRVDKRGMFGSKAAKADTNKVTIGDYATDVHSWIEVIRKRTGAPCVWVLGHSEGGLVALTAAQHPDGICGLVLVAAAGRPIGEVMRAQLAANPANAPILDEANAAITALENGKTVDTTKLNPALAPLFNPAIQAYESDLFGRDPAKLIAAYRGPVLIVQGERDIQVSVGDDARKLATADPRATLALIPNMNHVLKTVASDDRAANVATYGDPSLSLAPGVVERIADFVAAHPAK